MPPPLRTNEDMKYRDEDDKCYGLTGMAIGLTIFEAEDLFSEISLDGEGLDCITFTPAYYFPENPIIEPKDTWQHTLSRYQMTSALVIADAMCRTIFHDHKAIDRDLRGRLYEVISLEGKESCQLEDDEVQRLFDKTYRYLQKLLTNSQVQDVVKDFAGQLKKSRRMAQQDVAELLRVLR
jgi:hypothetical protein